jgi:hypothetical protein
MPEVDYAIEAWETFLDNLELELQQAAILTHGHSSDTNSSWVTPAAMPPLPQQLSDRVRKILDDQTAMLLRLDTTRRNTRKHLQYLDANAAKGMGSGPLFIDDLA